MFDNFDILIVPGWHNSGPDNWQSHWEHAFPFMQRVHQDNWDHPDYTQWAQRLSEYVERCKRPVIIVAHSLGTSLVTRWAQEMHFETVAGAFLVAPTDRDTELAMSNSAITGFAPMKLQNLPFPSMVVASNTDPHVSILRVQQFAKNWGSEYVDVGPMGHIGASEKLGLWAYGLVLFGHFLGSLKKSHQ